MSYGLSFRIAGYETYMQFHQNRTGYLKSGIAFGMFAPLTEEAKQKDWPEIQSHFLPHLTTTVPDYQWIFNYDDDYWNDVMLRELQGKHGVTYGNCLLRPKSRYDPFQILDRQNHESLQLEVP